MPVRGRLDRDPHRITGSGTLTSVNEQDWDERYASAERIWSGQPNAALVAEVADLTPGTALDVGCGEGADAVWLAQRGWQVTGLDISGVALDRGRAWASENGVEVTWLKSGLLEAGLAAGSFDLVVVMYPPLPRTPDAVVERALADLVAPGGRLLVVHHALHPDGGHGHRHHEHGEAHGHGHHGHGHHGHNDEHEPQGHHGHDEGHGPDFAAMVAPESVRPTLGEEWTIEVDDERDRSVSAGAGARHVTDVVLRARRAG